MLDMFAQENAADSQAPLNNTDRLPATFGDSFDAAHNDAELFSNSIAVSNARGQAVKEWADTVTRAGGNLDKYLKPGLSTEEDMVTAANSALKDLGPNQYLPPPMTMDDVSQRANDIMAGARLSLQDQQSRPQTWSSKLGGFLGSAVGGLQDPLNLPLMLVAPEFGGGIVGNALGWGVAMGGQQVANEAINIGARERAMPGYAATGQPAQNVIDATVGGMVLGGGAKGVANVVTRLRTGQWPRALQDAANALKSDDNIAKTNVLPGAEGEAEHRGALSTALNQVLRGDPVDVQIGEASRAVMARAEAERAGEIMPRSANMAEVSRLSEEAGLNTRRGQIGDQLSTMPTPSRRMETAAAAADRLNRLDAVESQLGRAEDAATRQRLLDRRDQILVDTNPETLERQARPLRDRQALESERDSIASRLDEIGRERARDQLAQAMAPRAEPTPAPLGQAEPVPRISSPVPQSLFDLHEQRIGGLAAETDAERLQQGVSSLARDGGYQMPAEEAKALSDRVMASKSVDEKRAILQQAAMSPRTVLDNVPSATEIARAESAASREAAAPLVQPEARARTTPQAVKASLADPKETETHFRDLEREVDARAQTGKRAMINTVDADGNVTTQTLASVMDDALADRQAAEALENACASELGGAA